MENAVEALKTAAAVLIFVIAITASFTMFSKAKQTADSITVAQDDQEYLEAAELENRLYTSSQGIASGTNAKITKDGYRIVNADDVISTIYRYNLEKYGVTLVMPNGTVLARFDSYTEGILKSSNLETEESMIDLLNQSIKKNTTVSVNGTEITPNISLKELYKIENRGNTKLTWGAPWYGNETEIIKRINRDIEGGDYVLFAGTGAEQIYNGHKIQEAIANKHIIEIVNEIDNSKYLQDGESKTSLLQQYEMPTIEIVYIIQS